MAADVKPAQARWETIRPRKTEAMPKVTLFGSNLEQKTDKQMDEIRKLDMQSFEKEQAKRGQNRRVRVQSHRNTSGELAGADYLEHTREEVKKATEQSQRMNRMLDVLEEKSKYFAVGTIPESVREAEKGIEKPGWLTNKDLENADVINKVGLAENKKGYNRDKYQKRPQVHQYSLIGDPLKPGMDFAEKDRDDYRPPVFHLKTNVPQVPVTKGRLQFYGPTYEAKTAIDVPANILHSYGTLVCNKILGDKEKIDSTLEKQEQIKNTFLRKREKSDEKVLPPLNVDPMYQDLGHKLRQDFFPGHTYNHHSSLAKEVYTRDVFDRRYPDPNEHRYQKDQHSVWNEYNSLQQRMHKKWAEYMQSRPKVEVNWDRNAKRPPPPPKKEEPKTKVRKQAPKKVESKSKSPDFPEVVFVTPPLTPPREPTPPQPPPARDDDFWSFYDQKV